MLGWHWLKADRKLQYDDAAGYAADAAAEREAQEQWWLTKLAAIRGCEIGAL